MSFGGGSATPTVVKVPDPPKVTDPSVEAAKATAVSQEKARKGYLSTILTSGEGDTSTVATGKKQLLGQ